MDLIYKEKQHNTMIKRFNEFINESTSTKIAFYSEILYELKRFLDGSIWAKVGGVDKRAEELMNIHKKFIEIAMDKLSAEEIAERLYKYEKTMLER